MTSSFTDDSYFLVMLSVLPGIGVGGNCHILLNCHYGILREKKISPIHPKSIRQAGKAVLKERLLSRRSLLIQLIKFKFYN